jgi:hypothetical protein
VVGPPNDFSSEEDDAIKDHKPFVRRKFKRLPEYLQKALDIAAKIEK